MDIYTLALAAFWFASLALWCDNLIKSDELLGVLVCCVFVALSFYFVVFNLYTAIQ